MPSACCAQLTRDLLAIAKFLLIPITLVEHKLEYSQCDVPCRNFAPIFSNWNYAMFRSFGAVDYMTDGQRDTSYMPQL